MAVRLLSFDGPSTLPNSLYYGHYHPSLGAAAAQRAAQVDKERAALAEAELRRQREAEAEELRKREAEAAEQARYHAEKRVLREMKAAVFLEMESARAEAEQLRAEVHRTRDAEAKRSVTAAARREAEERAWREREANAEKDAKCRAEKEAELRRALSDAAALQAELRAARKTTRATTPATTQTLPDVAYVDGTQTNETSGTNGTETKAVREVEAKGGVAPTDRAVAWRWFSAAVEAMPLAQDDWQASACCTKDATGSDRAIAPARGWRVRLPRPGSTTFGTTGGVVDGTAAAGGNGGHAPRQFLQVIVLPPRVEPPTAITACGGSALRGPGECGATGVVGAPGASAAASDSAASGIAASDDAAAAVDAASALSDARGTLEQISARLRHAEAAADDIESGLDRARREHTRSTRARGMAREVVKARMDALDARVGDVESCLLDASGLLADLEACASATSQGLAGCGGKEGEGAGGDADGEAGVEARLRFETGLDEATQMLAQLDEMTALCTSLNARV